MKTTRTKIASEALMALCLTFGGGLNAADQAYDLSKPGTDYGAKYQAKTAEGQPARFNKASGIVGMDVYNHKDERLGVIKDVVFDLKSERVAYAVLGTGGLMQRQKLVAVPLNAFSASADNRRLILRAEKSKLEMAAGIQPNNWPNVTNPSWGAETFWEKALPEGTIDKTDKFPDLKPKLDTTPDTTPETKPEQGTKPDEYPKPEQK